MDRQRIRKCFAPDGEQPKAAGSSHLPSVSISRPRILILKSATGWKPGLAFLSTPVLSVVYAFQSRVPLPGKALTSRGRRAILAMREIDWQ
jgi:hypothetical protein